MLGRTEIIQIVTHITFFFRLTLGRTTMEKWPNECKLLFTRNKHGWSPTISRHITLQRITSILLTIDQHFEETDSQQEQQYSTVNSNLTLYMNICNRGVVHVVEVVILLTTTVWDLTEECFMLSKWLYCWP